MASATSVGTVHLHEGVTPRVRGPRASSANAKQRKGKKDASSAALAATSTAGAVQNEVAVNSWWAAVLLQILDSVTRSVSGAEAGKRRSQHTSSGAAFVRLLLLPVAAFVGGALAAVRLDHLGAHSLSTYTQFLPQPLNKHASAGLPPFSVPCVGGVNVPEGWDLACFGWDVEAASASASPSPLLHLTIATSFDEGFYRVERQGRWMGARTVVWRAGMREWRALRLQEPGARMRQLLAVAQAVHGDTLLLSSPGPGTVWLRSPADTAAAFAALPRSNGSPVEALVGAVGGGSTGAAAPSPALILGRAAALSILLRDLPCTAPAADPPSPYTMDDSACLAAALARASSNSTDSSSSGDGPWPRMEVDVAGQVLHIVEPSSNRGQGQATPSLYWPGASRDPWRLTYDPIRRLWADKGRSKGRDKGEGEAQDRVTAPPAYPSVAHAADGPTALRVWELVQGKDNTHCGPFLCFAWYAGAAAVAGVVAGYVVWLAWTACVAWLVEQGLRALRAKVAALVKAGKQA